MSEPTHIGCPWIKTGIDPDLRNPKVKKLAAFLRTVEFDAIVVTGYSATIMGSILAHKMNKRIIVVRKESDKQNSTHQIEGFKGQKAILIDDCISSGETFRRVDKGLMAVESELIGVCLFEQDGIYPEKIERYKVLYVQDKPTERGSALASSSVHTAVRRAIRDNSGLRDLATAVVGRTV